MDQLTVMSFNIGHALARDGTVSVERVARVVAESGADLVGLQDIDRYCPRSYFEDQAAVLGQRLAMHHCFAPAGRLPGGLGSGLAILSRYPVIHHTSHRLAIHRADCVLQRAAIDFDGRRVTCLNASLKATGSGAPEAVRRIRGICRGLRTPALLTIDAVPGEPAAAIMADCWQPAGSGEYVKTPLRHNRPQGVVFFSPHWHINTGRVMRTAWSANWPVTAQAGLETGPKDNGQEPPAK